MPLRAKYTWQQTLSTVTILLATHGPSTNLDVIVTKCFLRVNDSPYITTLDFWGDVDDGSARVTHLVESKKLQITLDKASDGNWPQLTTFLEGPELELRRSQAMDEYIEKSSRRDKESKIVASEQASIALKQLFQEEAKERAIIEEEKDRIKKLAEADVFLALSKISENEEESKSPSPLVSREEDFEIQSIESAADRSLNDDLPPSQYSVSNSESFEALLPPPREIGKYAVSFTARAFPTPLRESKKSEEDDWLAKNYTKLQEKRRHGESRTYFVEKESEWLKEKGDTFFRASDFDSAINAYSAAIDANPTQFSCFSNRSLCYLQKHLFQQCISDSERALSILESLGPAEGKLSLHAKCLARIIAAHCFSGAYDKALEVANSSPKALENFHSELFAGLSGLQKLSHALELKVAGDKLYSTRNFLHAVEYYSSALDEEPKYVAVLLNRAAAYLSLADNVNDNQERKGYLQSCMSDCSTVLNILANDSFAISSNFEISAVPVKNSPLYTSAIDRANARKSKASSLLALCPQ